MKTYSRKKKRRENESEETFGKDCKTLRQKEGSDCKKLCGVGQGLQESLFYLVSAIVMSELQGCVSRTNTTSGFRLDT